MERTQLFRAALLALWENFQKDSTQGEILFVHYWISLGETFESGEIQIVSSSLRRKILANLFD